MNRGRGLNGLAGFQEILKGVIVGYGWGSQCGVRWQGSEWEPIPSGAPSLSEAQISFCCWLNSIHSSWSKYTVMSSNVTGAWKEKRHQVSTSFFLRSVLFTCVHDHLQALLLWKHIRSGRGHCQSTHQTYTPSLSPPGCKPPWEWNSFFQEGPHTKTRVLKEADSGIS